MYHKFQTTDPIREATYQALAPVLDVLLDLLFDTGITVQQFNSLVRSRAVLVATRHLLRGGEQGSKSRIAILTGLPRSEVARLSRLPDASLKSARGQQPARRIMEAWFTDPQFLNRSGEPRILRIFGTRCSFEKLVSKYCAGIPVRAMLDELIRIAAIDRLSRQRLRAKTRVPISVGFTPRAIAAIGERCTDLLATLTNNLRRKDYPLFEATSLVCDADTTLLPLIRRQISQQAINLISDANSLLQRSRTTSRKATRRKISSCRAGVTVYYFEDTEREERKSGSTPRRNLRREK